MSQTFPVEEFIRQHWHDGPRRQSADDYCLLSVKQSPDRRCIAIRTSVDDGEGPEWLLIDVDGKMQQCLHRDVVTWIDLMPPPQECR